MRILDAIRAGEKIADSADLSPEDKIAVHCLVQLAKKVHRLQKPLRQLERAICPKEELNQLALISDDD